MASAPGTSHDQQPGRLADERSLSDTTRSVHRTLERIRSCRCHGSPRVVVLRGFDSASRTRAADFTRQLRDGIGFSDVQVETQATPVLAALDSLEGHVCAVVDVTGRSRQTATLAWTWSVNQPEQGQLAVTLDGRTEVLTEVGAEVVVRPDEQGLVVQVLGASGQPLARRASSVVVRQVEGVHVLHRDGVLTGDAPGTMRVVYDERGAARHVL